MAQADEVVRKQFPWLANADDGSLRRVYRDARPFAFLAALIDIEGSDCVVVAPDYPADESLEGHQGKASDERADFGSDGYVWIASQATAILWPGGRLLMVELVLAEIEREIVRRATTNVAKQEGQ